MTAESHLPPDLQPVADDVLTGFAAGVEDPEGLCRICEWLEVDGWDFLIADLGEQNALKLAYIAQLEFSDAEARYNLDIPEDVEVQDADRLRWARQQIDYAESGDDTYLLASLHAYQLNGSDGSYAFLGCLIEVHGQGEPVCEWWGLWRTAEEFYDAVGDGGYNWVTPQMGEISDQVILSMWQKPKRRRKKVRVEVVVGHIVRQPDLDTLVNLVNANLRFGSGVAGAIHTAAGAELEQYCRRYSPIALGEAVVTPGFQLPNPYVIHARAASYINDDYPEKYLDLAITQALRVANDAGIKSMAMPAIGTGVFKFPPELVSCPADT